MTTVRMAVRQPRGGAAAMLDKAQRSVGDYALIDILRSDHYSDRMAKRVSATEAKATILALLDEVESGEEVEITRHGRLVARLVPAAPGLALRGLFAGRVWQTVPDEELLQPIPAEEWSGEDWLDEEAGAR